LGFKFIAETKRVISLLTENPQIGKTIPVVCAKCHYADFHMI
jgi:hypothetical protein